MLPCPYWVDCSTALLSSIQFQLLQMSTLLAKGPETPCRQSCFAVDPLYLFASAVAADGPLTRANVFSPAELELLVLDPYPFLLLARSEPSGTLLACSSLSRLNEPIGLADVTNGRRSPR